MGHRTLANPARGRTAMARSAGITIIELMITVTVLGFGIVGLLLMQAQAIQHSSTGKESTVALAIARSVFEQMPRVPFSSLPADGAWKSPAWIVRDGLLSGDPVLSAGVVGERVTDGFGDDHFRQMYRAWYRVSADPSAAESARVRSVEVQVIWADDDDVVVTPATITDERAVVLAGLIVDNDL